MYYKRTCKSKYICILPERKYNVMIKLTIADNPRTLGSASINFVKELVSCHFSGEFLKPRNKHGAVYNNEFHHALKFLTVSLAVPGFWKVWA